MKYDDFCTICKREEKVRTIKYITSRNLNIVISLLGIWVMISPFVLGFGGEGEAMQVDVMTGFAILLFGGVAMTVSSMNIGMYMNILNTVLGLWLLVTPFVLGPNLLSLAGQVNNGIVGLIVMVAAAYGLYDLYSRGGSLA